MAESIHYKFIVEGVDEDLLTLIQFSGTEAISRLYQYDIDIKGTLDLPDDFCEKTLSAKCQLQVFLGSNKLRTIFGVVAEIEESRFLTDGAIYRLQLVPNIWNLRHFDTNEVYLDQSIPEVIQTVLEEAELTEDTDFKLDISSDVDNDSWKFKLQYNETHLEYIQRITERDGIYYFFEEGASNEVVIFSNKTSSSSGNQLDFAPAGSSENINKPYTINNFVARNKRIPKKIRFRDFNPETPSQDIVGETEIDPKGEGCINIYGLNIRTPSEAERLADAHAQAYKATKLQFIGSGNVPTLSAGHTFELDRHPKTQYNQEYLVTELSFSGANLSYFQQNHDEAPPVCQCSYTAITADQLFVPIMQAEKPQVTGTLHAVIDTDGSTGDHAMLDEVGRYKVKLPFDRKNQDDAKASHWIRMAQPFGGDNEGMHFPLRKGTHVLLSFIGGDPDCPVIASTIGDSSEQSSIVNDENHTNRVIQTVKGNKIEIEDKEESNRIKLESPHASTYFHLGAPNASGAGLVSMTAGMERLVAQRGSQITHSFGDLNNTTIPTTPDAAQKAALEAFPTSLYEFTQLNSQGSGTTSIDNAKELSGIGHFHRRKGPLYSWTESDEYHYGGGNVFNFGNSYEETHAFDSNNAKLAANTQDLDTVTGPKPPNAISDLNDYESVQVAKTWSDTYEYQKGANFAWGDTEDYNFGNGYEENIVSGSAINQTYPHDKNSGPGAASSGKHMSLPGDDTLVGKTIGDTYEYVKGKTLAVTVGNSEEHVFNDSGALSNYAYTDSSSSITSEEHVTASTSIKNVEKITASTLLAQETVSMSSGIAEDAKKLAGAGIAASEITAAGAGIATNEITAAGAGIAASEITTAGAAMLSSSIEIAGLARTSFELSVAGVMNTDIAIATSPALRMNVEVDTSPIHVKSETGPGGSENEMHVGGSKITGDITAARIATATGAHIKTKAGAAITTMVTGIETGATAIKNGAIEIKNKALNLMN